MKTKKLSSFHKIAALCLAFLLIFSSLPFLSGMLGSLGVWGYETNTFKDFQPAAIGLENPQFANHSGSLPAEPSGWTETSYANKNKGATAMGVLDLDSYNTEENRKAAKLEEYPEYASAVPISPFGKRGVIAAQDGNDKILMVNTTEATETVIGYESSTVTLAANKFFRISAWVKTGDFYSQYGAAVRLNGIPNQSVAFSNIRTATSETLLTKENVFGWKQYSFYIQTSSVRSESVSLALTVGDYYRGTDENGGEVIINQNAKGYAFFGNVEAYEISPTAFNIASLHQGQSNDVYGDNVQFIDLSLSGADPITGEKTTDGKQTDNLSFHSNGGNVLENYTIATAKGTGLSSSDLVYPAILNTELTFNVQNNPFGLNEAPIPPTGKYSDGNGYVMVLSSYRGTSGINVNYKETAVGYESGNIKIKQFQYYRLSVWVNTQDITSGAGATLVVTTDRESRNNPNEMIEFRATGCTGNASNGASYGFTEYAFYLKGSVYRDYHVTLGLWLGQENNHSKGIALFANPRFEALTAAQYNAEFGSSAGGSAVDIDIADAETGVINGNFAGYTATDEIDALPLVSDWTKGTPVMTENADSVIGGIMFTDEAHYQANHSLYGQGAVRPLQEASSVLYMASPAKNAFSYTSASITLEESGSYTLTTSLRIDNAEGYGASLVLKDENGTIATIENITDTSGRFHDFTFYIQNDAARNLSLEIWLGMSDREGTLRKLSSGNLYVNSVSLTSTDDSIFLAAQTNYQHALNNWNIFKTDYAAYSYTTMNFTEFDPYSSGFIKYPYLWSVSGPSAAIPVTVRSGIFDSANIPAGVGDIPSYFQNPDRADENGKLARNNVLLLSNGAKTSSQLVYDRAFNLEPNMYYQLDVSIKVDIKVDSDTMIGAGIKLIGTNFAFENITDTIDPLDPSASEAFKTFTFYLATSESAESFQLAFTLGGEKASEFCSGNLYVNSVTFTDITNTLYDEETSKITRDTNHILRAAFDTAAEDNNETVTQETPGQGPTSTADWGLVPSILFAAALLLALGWIIARRVGDNLRTRRVKRGAGTTATAASDYDRKATVEKGFADFTGEKSEDLSSSDEQHIYDEFDDTNTIADKSNKERKLEARKETIESATLDTETGSVTETKAESEFLDSFED